MGRPDQRKPSGPTPAVATVNARGVFHSVPEPDEVAVGDLPKPRTFLVADDEDDDKKTEMYRPRRNGRPMPARAARVVEPAPPPVRTPLPSVQIRPDVQIPRPARMPGLQLETVAARAPRTSIPAGSESTPAVSFQADRELTPTRTTVPVPRATTPSRLPYLASGVLALAAGALVVLLAGVGKRTPYPASWERGAVAESMRPAAPRAAAQLSSLPLLPDSVAAPVRAALPPGAPVAPRPASVATKPRVAAVKPEIRTVKPEPRAAKPEKTDDDLANAKKAAAAASEALGDSL